MQFSPGLDEPALCAGQLSYQELNRVDTKHGYVLLVVGVEVRRVVRLTELHEHADDDPEEPAEFWHAESFYDPIAAY